MQQPTSRHQAATSHAPRRTTRPWHPPCWPWTSLFALHGQGRGVWVARHFLCCCCCCMACTHCYMSCMLPSHATHLETAISPPRGLGAPPGLGTRHVGHGRRSAWERGCCFDVISIWGGVLTQQPPPPPPSSTQQAPTTHDDNEHDRQELQNLSCGASGRCMHGRLTHRQLHAPTSRLNEAAPRGRGWPWLAVAGHGWSWLALPWAEGWAEGR
jgi:hypothetical protein